MQHISTQNVGSEWRAGEEGWAPFLKQHPQWCRQRIGDNTEPAYTLPEFVVTALSAATEARGNKRAIPRLLSEADEQAERSFRETCESYLPDTIGVWRGQPVQYPPFNVRQDLGFNELQLRVLAKSCGNTEQQIKSSLKVCETKSVETRHQLLGYVGFLSLDEQFIAEREQLKNLWRELPADSLLPQTSASLLAAPLPAQLVPGSGRLSDKHQSFYSGLRELINKWHLTGFATWDLPLPQGPLASVPVGAISRLRGSDATINYVPAYFDIPSKVNQREESRESQRLEGQAAGVNSEFPLTDISARHGKSGNLEPSSYATIFRIWFAEVTLHRRYGKIHGVKARLDEAFADEMRISEERVKKLRQEYAGAIE